MLNTAKKKVHVYVDVHICLPPYFLLLVKITNFDLVYTAISRIASNCCDDGVKNGAWAYWGVYGFFSYALVW